MSHVLEPDPRLGDDIRREGEMCVHAKRRLVEDQLGMRVAVSVEEFRLGRRAEVLVGAPKESYILH